VIVLIRSRELAKSLLEKTVLSLIGGIKPDSLKVAIDRGLHTLPTVAELMKVDVEDSRISSVKKLVLSTLGFVRMVISEYPDLLDRLTTENVLKWLKEKKSEWYEVITSHPNGIKWLDEEVLIWRKYLSGKS